MHISKIELENIKSHRNSTYHFKRGTTAITGENGAGKTSIIEAVAWVLFDLLEYKKEDFVRRGAKKGSVKITFESSVDEREYVVFRDTGAGYHVTDPRLEQRIANKKDEVVRFLWLHLGLEPGTDLKTLFRQAIGVPQGTFTAIFLEGATERKTAFDRLLKVEEYRQAAEKLRETSRFIDAGLIRARETIARTEGELARSKTVETEHEGIANQLQALTGEIDQLASELVTRQLRVSEFDDKEGRVSSLRSEVERSRVDHEKAELIRKQSADALERSIDATAKLDAARSEHERHLKSLAQLRDLETRRVARDAIRAELAKIDTSVANVRVEQKYVDADLQKLTSTRQRIAELSAKANEQGVLETRIDDLKSKIAAARSADERIVSIERELARLRERFKTSKAKLSDAEARAPREKIAELEKLHSELVESYSERKTEIEEEGRELTNKKTTLEERKNALISFEREMASAKTTLAKLVDPAAQIRVLEKELLREPDIRSRLTDTERNLERLETERRQMAEQLEDFVAFDDEVKRIAETRDATTAAHRSFLANENEAAALEQRKTELASADETRSAALAAAQSAESRLTAAGIDYDAGQHAAARTALLDVERRLAEKRATLDVARGREKQLGRELAQFANLRKTLNETSREKDQLSQTGEVTSFIRDTLKEAAPRVARNYVHYVSLEANQMFREIAGDAEQTLKWNEDYSISLEEEGFERPFQSLSGGEQMAAALAVRLALLKQLSDIRIAFFDEPTTNMDAERRENFALQVSRIENFDQLFVISHDETFDNYVDNVVHIERHAHASA